MNPLFEMQRNAMRQTQEMMRRGVDMQKRMTESAMQTNLDVGQSAQRQGTELTRNWLDAYFRTFGQMAGQRNAEEVSQTLDDEFEQFTNAQEDAWNAFEESIEQAMAAYDDLTQSQKELIDRSFDSFYEMQRETGERVSDAAEEVERQAQESGSSSSSESSE